MQQNQEEGGGWEWGGTIYIGNRGKNEKTRGKDAISRAAESWGLLVHTHLKKIPKQEGSLAGTEGQSPWKASDHNSPNESRRPGPQPAALLWLMHGSEEM